jgi:hypothetical protein
MTRTTKVLSIEELKSSKMLADRFTAARPSIADRLASGKRLRTNVPLENLAELKRPKHVKIRRRSWKTRPGAASRTSFPYATLEC